MTGKRVFFICARDVIPFAYVRDGAHTMASIMTVKILIHDLADVEAVTYMFPLE